MVITSTNSPVTWMRNKHLRRHARLPLDVWKEHALYPDVSCFLASAFDTMPCSNSFQRPRKVRMPVRHGRSLVLWKRCTRPAESIRVPCDACRAVRFLHWRPGSDRDVSTRLVKRVGNWVLLSKRTGPLHWGLQASLGVGGNIVNVFSDTIFDEPTRSVCFVVLAFSEVYVSSSSPRPSLNAVPYRCDGSIYVSTRRCRWACSSVFFLYLLSVVFCSHT